MFHYVIEKLRKFALLHKTNQSVTKIDPAFTVQDGRESVNGPYLRPSKPGNCDFMVEAIRFGCAPSVLPAITRTGLATSGTSVLFDAIRWANTGSFPRRNRRKGSYQDYLGSPVMLLVW